MFVVLGWIGWLWLGIFALLLTAGLLVQRHQQRRRRRTTPDGSGQGTPRKATQDHEVTSKR
jgi:hypothetical protein